MLKRLSGVETPAQRLLAACDTGSLESAKAICAQVRAYASKTEEEKETAKLVQDIEAAKQKSDKSTQAYESYKSANQTAETGVIVRYKMQSEQDKQAHQALLTLQKHMMTFRSHTAKSEQSASASELFAFDKKYDANALHLAQDDVFVVVWNALPEPLRAVTLSAQDAFGNTPLMSTIDACTKDRFDRLKLETLLRHDKSWITNPELGAKVLVKACLEGNRGVLMKVVGVLTPEQLNAIRQAAAKSTSLMLMVECNKKGLTVEDYYDLVLQGSIFFNANGRNLLMQALRDKNTGEVQRLCQYYNIQRADDRITVKEVAGDIFAGDFLWVASQSSPEIFNMVLKVMPHDIKKQQLLKSVEEKADPSSPAINRGFIVDHVVSALCAEKEEKSFDGTARALQLENLQLLLDDVPEHHLTKPSVLHNKNLLEVTRDGLHDEAHQILMARVKQSTPAYKLKQRATPFKDILDYLAAYATKSHPINFGARKRDFVLCLQAIKENKKFPDAHNSTFIKYAKKRGKLEEAKVTMHELRQFVLSMQKMKIDHEEQDKPLSRGMEKLIKKMDKEGLFDWFKEVPAPVITVEFGR